MNFYQFHSSELTVTKSSQGVVLVQDEFSDAAPGADRSLSETSPSTSSYIGDDDYGDDDGICTNL